MAKDVKFGFGTDQDSCEAEEFDSIDELIEYAQASWDEKDGNPFDEDCEYSGSIFIGILEWHSPYDFAPSLDEIADSMTDRFYCDYNVDDDAETQICNKKEAEEVYKEFVNKYFDIPHTLTSRWIGEYDLTEHKWIEKYADFNVYVKE